jgi:hypothetical protein
MKAKGRLTLDAVRRRLTGFSIPVFGVPWSPSEPRRDAARRLVTFLEDRRVLYAPEEMEVPSHCVTSVVDIRRHITEELQRGPDDDDLAQSMRAMRASCRKFLDIADGDVVRFGGRSGHWASWKFNGALGELRGLFGLHLTRIAVQYGVEIEDDLATILPAEDEGD